jgi:SAM-dependent methyltransferase
MGPGRPDAAELEADWASRVRGNREQVDRLREVADPTDFYAPVTAMFRDDPTRTDDPVLNRLLALAEPADTWLDIGAGAGRYALPLARAVREVVAIDPSPGMLATLATEIDHWHIKNIRTVGGRWPEWTPELGAALAADMGGEQGVASGSPAASSPHAAATPDWPAVDVALMAHVGYDIEAIGPFVDAMNRVARRRCVAVLMEHSPASVADPFWPPIQGEPRVALPALPEFLAFLLARGCLFEVVLTVRSPRRWASRSDLAQFLRRGLWLAPDSPKARRLDALLEGQPLESDGSLVIDHGQRIGIVSWEPPQVAAI